MAKPQPTELNSKDLKLECRYIIEEAFDEIKELCEEHINTTKKELKKNKEKLSKHNLKLKELNKKKKIIDQSIKKKKTATLQNRLKTTNSKIKDLNKTITALTSDISHLSKELTQFKLIKSEESNNLKQFKTFKKQAQPTKKKTVKKNTQKNNPLQKSLPITLPEPPELKVGDLAPEITSLITTDQLSLLSEHKGKNIVLYFYPKDNTPGCTKQAIDFTAYGEKFNALETIIIGVSRDSLQSHKNFKDKHQLNLTLLSDPDESLCQAFGVIRNKNSFGKIVRGIQRSTFLIDKEGKIQKIWRGVKVPEHAEEVLNSLA